LKNKSIIAILLVGILLLTTISALAATRASTIINSTSIVLGSSMKATFSCSAKSKTDISVGSVKLEVQNANGTWSFVKNLSAPASASNVSIYNKPMDYSSSCTKGKTYRITGTFYVGNDTATRTSPARTYE